MLNPTTLQWLLMLLLSVGMFLLSPRAEKINDFFKGSKNEQQPGFWVLTSSLVISWLFAKSITNAADLGQAFGFVGGVAYAGYYASFIIAGVIIYKLRTKGGFQSIHDFLRSKFGNGAVMIFTLLIAFRLFNEVWSNSMGQSHKILIVADVFGSAAAAEKDSCILLGADVPESHIGLDGVTLPLSRDGPAGFDLVHDHLVAVHLRTGHHRPVASLYQSIERIQRIHRLGRISNDDQYFPLIFTATRHTEELPHFRDAGKNFLNEPAPVQSTVESSEFMR